MFKDGQNFTYDFDQSQTQFLNGSCDWNSIPSAEDYIDSLECYGIGLIVFGSLLCALTFCTVVNTLYRIVLQNEPAEYKINCVFLLSIYPIASLCSLLATAVPRAQLLSENLTQIWLMVCLYRLFLLLIDLGQRSVNKPPSMLLKVGPCCCWPCLSFPNIEMNQINITWLRFSVLQLTIIQGLTSCVILFLGSEEIRMAQFYGAFLQPIALMSLLFGLYGLTVTTKSLHDCAPNAALPRRAIVTQLVLLFSKFQCFIIKSLPITGMFPCHPPLTPPIYANLIYNFLMLIEMLTLSWIARKIYTKTDEQEEGAIIETCATKNNVGQAEVTFNNEVPNI